MYFSYNYLVLRDPEVLPEDLLSELFRLVDVDLEVGLVLDFEAELLVPPDDARVADFRSVFPEVALVDLRVLLSRVAGFTVPDEPVDLRLLPDSVVARVVPDSFLVAGRLVAFVSVVRVDFVSVVRVDLVSVARVEGLAVPASCCLVEGRTLPLSPVDLRPLLVVAGRVEGLASRLG
jgi:hypothetical protein